VRLTQVAQAHADNGCRRLYYDYERDAVDGDEYLNYKAFRRIYRLAGLQMGRRRRRGRAKIVRGRSLRRATRPFERWTLDVIQDRLFNGRSFRGLTMMDEVTRVDLALELNYSFPSKSVIDVLDDVARASAATSNYTTRGHFKLYQSRRGDLRGRFPTDSSLPSVLVP